MLVEAKNFLLGIKQTLPSHAYFNGMKQSEKLRANYSQFLYFNLICYLLPVVIFNLIVNPLISYFELDGENSKIRFAIKWAYPILLLRLILEFLLYNTVFALTTAKLAATDNAELNKAIEAYKENHQSNCDCTQTDKLKKIVRSPIYYLSNHMFASIISTLTSPKLGFAIKTHIYGRALTETYIDHAELCVEHKREWLSKRNMLCLGIGFSFMLTNYLTYGALNYLIYSLFNISLDSIDVLSNFIVQDILFNITWFISIHAILTNPSILNINAEYVFDLYHLNNSIALKTYDLLKSPFKKLIKQNKKPNKVLTNIKELSKEFKLDQVFNYLLPSPFRTTKQLLKSKPIQLYLNINYVSLLELTAWLSSLNKRARPIVLGSELIGAKNILKGFLNNWLPETLIIIVFELISRDVFAENNILWLNKKIQKSSPFIDDSKWMRYLNKRYIAKDLKQEFELLEDPNLTRSTPNGTTIKEPSSTNPTPNTMFSEHWERIEELYELNQEQPHPDDTPAPDIIVSGSVSAPSSTSMPLLRLRQTNPQTKISQHVDNDWISTPRENIDNDSIDETVIDLMAMKLILPKYKQHRVITPSIINEQHFPAPGSC